MNWRFARGAWWVALLALGLTAYLAWRLPGRRSTGPESSSSAPALAVSIDFRAVREVPAGLSLINQVMNLGEPLSRWLALLQGAQVLERMDLLLEPRGAYILAQGEFTPQSLRQSIEQAGGRCAGSLQEYPCTLAADPAGCTISVFTPANGRFTAACAKTPAEAQSMAEQGAGDGLSPFAGFGVEDDFDGIAGLMVNPARLGPLMREAPTFVPNLSIVARALEKASQAKFLLRREEAGALAVHLEASSPTGAEAEQVQTLLAGLNDFAAAAADFGRGDKESNDWSTLLRSARFSRQGSALTGVWTIDAELLRRLTRD